MKIKLITQMKNLIKKNKNKLKRKYKNGVEQEYLDIHNKKLESIDDKGKRLLFKTLKTEYMSR